MKRHPSGSELGREQLGGQLCRVQRGGVGGPGEGTGGGRAVGLQFRKAPTAAERVGIPLHIRTLGFLDGGRDAVGEGPALETGGCRDGPAWSPPDALSPPCRRAVCPSSWSQSCGVTRFVYLLPGAGRTGERSERPVTCPDERRGPGGRRGAAAGGTGTQGPARRRRRERPGQEARRRGRATAEPGRRRTRTWRVERRLQCLPRAGRKGCANPAPCRDGPARRREWRGCVARRA